MERSSAAPRAECSDTPISASFRLESDLCSVLIDAVENAAALGEPGTLLRELRVGTVIPDLVLVRAMTQAGRGFSSFESWVIAALLRSRRLTVETLARRLYARPVNAKRALHALLRRQIVRRLSGDTYELLPDWFPVDPEVVAVEAKLTRWREAVEQASAYLRFSDRSYVAVPPETVRSAADLLPACCARGLGLLTVEPNGVTVLRRAPRHRIRSAEWVWVLGRAFAHQGATGSNHAQARCATLADVPELFED